MFLLDLTLLFIIPGISVNICFHRKHHFIVTLFTMNVALSIINLDRKKIKLNQCDSKSFVNIQVFRINIKFCLCISV